MQANLEKITQPKFNFFHSMKARPHLSSVDMVGGVLIAASVLFGFSYRAELRQLPAQELASSQANNPIKSNYAEISNALQEIEFDKNPEKMKKEIWDKFAVPSHFAYITQDNAELGFTYKGENFTANINKDKEKTYLYVPAHKYVITQKDGRAYLLKDQ